MHKIIFGIAALLISTTITFADFERWSIENEKDPFSGGEKITASYSSSSRSGILVTCDTSKVGIEIKAIAGWRADNSIYERKIEPQIAVDGELLDVDPQDASGGLYGNSIAGIIAKYNYQDSELIINAWKKAKSQIALKDSISDKPYLLNAKGSTKSGEALEKCLVKQQKEIQNTSVENTFDELPESSTQCQVFERKLFSTERKILREDKEKGLKFFYFGDADTLPGFAHYRCEDDEPIVRFNLIISDIDKAAIILSGGAIYASAVLSDVMQIDNTTLVTKVSNCLNQSLKNVEKNGLGIGSASMVRFNPEDPSDLLVCQFPELIEGTASFTLDFFEN